MRYERILTVALFAIMLGGAFAVQTGYVRLGPAASTALQVSANLEVPLLDNAAMIRRGAAHYEIVCAGCHASPISPERADHLRLTPPAPKLHLRRDDWLPEVLFLTVKHGIANSGMPAWPAQGRDDEIWSMVAFLQVLPEMDAQDYRALTGLMAETGGVPDKGHICARCHGATGLGDARGAFPRLDIQSADYLRQSLQAYRSGQRQSGFMAGIAGSLDEAEIALLARHFAAPAPEQEPVVSTPPPAQTGGDRVNGPATCAVCHGPPRPARPEFPTLAGQSADYLAIQLRLFAHDPFTRGGSPFVDLMVKAGHALTEAEILNAAEHFSRLVKPGTAN